MTETDSAGALAREMAHEIDTAPLEQLIGIRQEQTRLDGFRARAESLKDQVDDAVYQRVVRDYTGRRAALEERAAPLKAQAGQEYRTLLTLRGRTEATHEDARLVRQELQFRQAVGELDEAALAAQVREPEQTLERCRAELATLDALKARFIEAFGTEEELAAATPVEGAAVEAAPRVDAAAGEGVPGAAGPGAVPVDVAPVEVVRGEAVLGDAGPGSVASSAAGSSKDRSSDASASETVYRGAPAAAAPVEADAVAREADADEEVAVLIEAADSAQPIRHVLSVRTLVGRSEDNSFRLANPSVSRQHAILTATPNGYVLQDLRSQNGTFVNGERVETHTLRDGDQILFGDAAYTFRLSRAEPRSESRAESRPPEAADAPASESAPSAESPAALTPADESTPDSPPAPAPKSVPEPEAPPTIGAPTRGARKRLPWR